MGNRYLYIYIYKFKGPSVYSFWLPLLIRLVSLWGSSSLSLHCPPFGDSLPWSGSRRGHHCHVSPARLGKREPGRALWWEVSREASLSLTPAGSLKRLVYSSSSSFPLGNWGQDRCVRVRTAAVPPFSKGSREKGDDYFGSLLPSPPLLFGLFLMPAGFSEEVGGSRRERRRSTSC